MTTHIQHVFLARLKDSQSPITVFLTNGVKLSGHLTAYDDEVLTLTRDGITQLVYRHAISTVMPSEVFSIYDLIDEMAD